ncbi:4'-phosphopantetheinyl transferase family protein [Lunatimonas salinarum]|uniref:4'-phosphopantetheinyl transferase family protein n=1 Tax=Lunatimonas salinarum TaxID=1774590 RepID=UPI001AE010A7|nr:4'-phosphopantetheinyl transferase superfamily protein [Lunatimonas salinarum]
MVKLFMVDTDSIILPGVYREVLSTEEQEKANSFAFDWLKKRYLVGRYLLRQQIGAMLNLDPGSLCFEQDLYGKWRLCGIHSLHFNLSYTGTVLLIGLADFPLGIDIERIKDDFAYQDIVAHYFSPREAAFIDSSDDSSDAFFLLWTRKEAILKAIGIGLVDDLHAVPALQSITTNNKGSIQLHTGTWQVNSYSLDGNFRISVACGISGFEVDFSFLGG